MKTMPKTKQRRRGAGLFIGGSTASAERENQYQWRSTSLEEQTEKHSEKN
jgi:hypothetical protein